MNTYLISQIIQNVAPGFLCEFFLIIFTLVDRTFKKSTLRSFIIAILFAFLLTVTDSIDYYCEKMLINIPLRVLIGSLSFIFRIGCVVFIIAIAQRKNKIHLWILFILFSLNTLICILNIWTGIIFKINPDHTWSVGPLFFVPYLIIMFAIAFFISSAIVNFRTNLGESVIIIAICVSSLTANFLELFLQIKFVLPQTFAVCVVFYFLCLNVELYKRDALTDLFNRRSFYLDAIRHKNTNMIVVSMDLNDLKKYNDNFGHDAGDAAIKTVVKCMLVSFKKIGFVYRTGGDEFMALIKGKKMQYIDSAISTFEDKLSKTEYQVAYGYAEYKPGDDFEAIIKIADEKMYEKKKELKSKFN